MYCAHCGKKIPENAVFCSMCGKKTGTEHHNSQIDNNKGAKGKAILAVPLLVICIILVSYFFTHNIGPKDKTEADMARDLSVYSDFYPSQDLEIQDLKIIKRQTDISHKQDVAYVSIKAKNDNIQCNLSYVLEYHLYNEGWVLDSVAPYKNDKWNIMPLKGPTLNDADKIMRNTDGMYVYLRDELDSENGICTYYYSVLRRFDYIEKHSEVTVRFRFDKRSLTWVFDKKTEDYVGTT